ncbi:MAG: T9SS type A sorting domain-containing protein [Bacteroidota bacterium]
MKTLAVAVLSLLIVAYSKAETKRVLFIGNSYIYTNNLPQVLKDVALSNGDDVIFDNSTPGGHTFQQHSTNATTLSKIAQGNWDYIILQEQSQRPAFPISQVQTEVFPYAAYLDSLAKAQNPCATVMYYMTWGRKNGDASNCQFFPPLCTYAGMDSLLRLRYQMMADDNSSEISPVGPVWNYIRTNFPSIELYSADESHPNATGTYAGALSFYSAIFRKSPLNVTYNSTVSIANAALIKEAVEEVVFQNMEQWNIGDFDPLANFEIGSGVGAGEFVFTNLSENSTEYTWDFGDGTALSTESNPLHVYAEQGNYNVMLVSKKCNRMDTIIQNLNYFFLSDTKNLKENMFDIFPNPNKDVLKIEMQTNFSGSLQIRDALGKEIYNANLQNNISNFTIDTKDFKGGLYFISFRNEIGEVFKKFIKQ